MKVTLEHSFQLMTCGKCHIRFYYPQEFYEKRKQDGATWYCPQGHPRAFTDPEIDQLRRERDRLKQDTARLEDERRRAEARAEKAEKEKARVVKRAIAAVCPCCNRSFANVTRHMKTKHPDVVALPVRKVP